jgi:two-component system response regulator HydG
VERLGGNEPVAIDVRIVAATHRDLRAMVAAGTFRQDLYYRLSVLVVALPPLRDRRDDIEAIALYFLEASAGRGRREVVGIAPQAKELLLRYAWPGNVRELRNVIERAVVFGSGPLVRTDDLPPEIRGHPAAAAEPGLSLPMPLGELERLDVEAALAAAGGNKSKAARILGIDRPTLYAKLKSYG